MEYNILSLARDEYTDKLCNTLKPLLYEGIKTIWDDVKSSSNEKCLLRFQQQLSLVPKWNKEIINNECDRISKKINISQLEKIVEAVFLFNIKILSSISEEKDIHLTIPEIKHFIHKCYINCARDFYTNPYVIDDRERGTVYDNIKIQKNYKESLGVINDSIGKTIKECIPIEQILEQYLNSESKNDLVDSDSDTGIEDVETDDADAGVGTSADADADADAAADVDADADADADPETGVGLDTDLDRPNLTSTSGENIQNVEYQGPPVETQDTKVYQEFPENNNEGVFQTISLPESGKEERRQESLTENFFD